MNVKQPSDQHVTRNPLPIVPLRNDTTMALDLDALGSDPLYITIKGNHIGGGDEVYMIWRGAAPDGTPFDELGAAQRVPNDYDPAVGWDGFFISNRLVVSTKDGWGFISYKVNDPAESSEDSFRVFCYVGKRPQPAGERLPVAQALQSHDRVIVWDELETDGVLFLVPPYQAMQEGDRVDLVLTGYTSDGTQQPPETERLDVTADDVGQALQCWFAKSIFTRIREGRAEVQYRITLAGRPPELSSAVQTFSVARLPSTVDLLPKPEVEGYTGGPIDPGVYPRGLTVRVPSYPGLQPSDHLLLYWQDAITPVPDVQVARMDLSSVEASEIVFSIAAGALKPAGERSLLYHFAREGEAMASEPLSLQVVPGRQLQLPIIEQAENDGEEKQRLFATSVITGAYVIVPEIDLAPGERIEVVWQGPVDEARQVVDTPEKDSPRRFKIAPGVIAASMHQPSAPESRRFPVFYRIVADGAPDLPSPSIDLRVEPLAVSSYPTLFCAIPSAPTGDLHEDQLQPQGALLRLMPWSFIGLGQLLTLYVEDVAVLRDAQPVTAEEIAAGWVDQWLSKEVFARMENGKVHRVHAKISFDSGVSDHRMPALGLTPHKK